MCVSVCTRARVCRCARTRQGTRSWCGAPSTTTSTTSSAASAPRARSCPRGWCSDRAASGLEPVERQERAGGTGSLLLPLYSGRAETRQTEGGGVERESESEGENKERPRERPLNSGRTATRQTEGRAVSLQVSLKLTCSACGLILQLEVAGACCKLK